MTPQDRRDLAELEAELLVEESADGTGAALPPASKPRPKPKPAGAACSSFFGSISEDLFPEHGGPELAMLEARNAAAQARAAEKASAHAASERERAAERDRAAQAHSRSVRQRSAQRARQQERAAAAQEVQEEALRARSLALRTSLTGRRSSQTTTTQQQAAAASSVSMDSATAGGESPDGGRGSPAQRGQGRRRSVPEIARAEQEDLCESVKREEELRQLFHLLDSDMDGMLTAPELDTAMTVLGLPCTPPTHCTPTAHSLHRCAPQVCRAPRGCCA
jgi:hypothetical protein